MVRRLGLAFGPLFVLFACATGEEGIDDPGFSDGGSGNVAGDAGEAGSGGDGGSGGSGFGGSGFGGSGFGGSGGVGGASFGGSSGFGGTGGASFGGSSGFGGSGGGSGFGGTGGTGGSTGGVGGTGGSGGGTTCSDPGPEPNDSESAAINKPQINDCDGSGASVTGMVAGSGDADWYKFKGDDDFGCVVNPYAFSNAVNVGARLCAFADCGGTTELKSCKQGTSDFSPSGLKGCCTTTSTQVELEINCPGTTEDNATIYIRIDQPSGNACIPYTIDYHY